MGASTGMRAFWYASGRREKAERLQGQVLGASLKKGSHDQAYELQSMLLISPLNKLHNGRLQNQPFRSLDYSSYIFIQHLRGPKLGSSLGNCQPDLPPPYPLGHDISPVEAECSAPWSYSESSPHHRSEDARRWSLPKIREPQRRPHKYFSPY